MLFSRLMLLLPLKGPAFSPVWFLLLTLIGVVLWLAGTRFSRATLVLASVTVGAVFAKKAVAAFGFHPDPMAAVIGGAVAAALAMIFVYRLVIAVSLAALLATWSAAALWIHAALPTVWRWPTPKVGGPSWASVAIAQLPVDLAQPLVAVGAVTFFIGLLLAAMMPRLARALFWSMLGVTVITAAGLAYGVYGNSGMLTMLPAQTHHQVLLLATAVLIGIGVQAWPRKGVSSHAPLAEPAPALG